MTVVAGESERATLLNLVRRPKADPYAGVIGTFMARDALALAATHLGLSRGDAVLLPAYLCKEVLRPFAGRSQIRFYDVSDDLSVDPDAIRTALARERIRLIIIINYFGFLQPWRAEIARHCVRHGTVLLEDCAHSLLTSGSGDTGDLSVVSFRKLLPVFDGGGLTIRAGSAGFAFTYHPRLYANALSILATAKALSGFRSDALSRAGVSDRRAPDRTPGRAGMARKVLPLSWFASNGAANSPTDAIVDRRRDDYGFWQDLVATMPGVMPVMPGLGDGVCPLGFPVVSRERDAWKRRLERAGLPVTIHWRLPPGADDGCANSHRLSSQMITLPVFPHLTAEARARMRHVAAEGWHL